MNLIVIAGPTASGKTALSVKLAKQINGEIVNADSMQVYKYMDIGTAKPSIEEREGIKHYLIDEIMPNESFSVAKYIVLANKYIDEIIKKGKTPILVGGTGLYIDSIVNNIKYPDIKTDQNYREELNIMADLHGNEYIYNMLQIIDSESSKKISIQDRRRIIRALEIYHTTGETMTMHNIKSRLEPSPYNSKIFALDISRDELYERINKRVDIMFDDGLVEEVKKLISMGINENDTSMQGIGYKEIVLYLNNQITLDDSKNLIKQSSRRYAKRQLTWFRRNEKIIWLQNADNIFKFI